jgi:hypothetical protein
MINYPKIQSLFKRDPKTKYATFLPEYSCPEFEYLKDCQWEWVEKIDGTNIKLYFEPHPTEPVACWKRVIGGRTEKAQLPPHLLDYLHNLSHDLGERGKIDDIFDCPVTLYGEGYGHKINGGDKYRDDVGFILFDIRIGSMWLRRADIMEIGVKLGIEVAPTIDICTCQEAINIIKPNAECLLQLPSKVFKSGRNRLVCEAEGLVGQPVTPLLTRLGKRIITKLKTKDFQND